LLLHLKLGCFELCLELLDPLVDAVLAALDLQVQLIISRLIKVLFESLVGLLLQAIKIFIDLRKLILQFFSSLNPKGRQ
jgi:hypothetical protein